MIFKGNGHARSYSPDTMDNRIEQETEARVRYLSLRGKDDIDYRLKELDTEWDIERMLEVNAGGLALTGVILASMFNKKWLILSGIVTAFLIQHAIQGWSPPVLAMRMMGIRTKAEIEKERTALRAIRGDFKETSVEKDELKKADKALKALNGE